MRIVIRSYDTTQTVREEPLDDLKSVVSKRNELGTGGVIKAVTRNVHERGIRTAGDHVLPIWGIGSAVVTFLLLLIGESSGGTLGALGLLAATFGFLGLWLAGPLMIYWDCLAGERYLGNSWRLGKLIAAGSIFIPVLGFLLQIKYRSRKFNEVGA